MEKQFDFNDEAKYSEQIEMCDFLCDFEPRPVERLVARDALYGGKTTCFSLKFDQDDEWEILYRYTLAFVFDLERMISFPLTIMSI